MRSQFVLQSALIILIPAIYSLAYFTVFAIVQHFFPAQLVETWEQTSGVMCLALVTAIGWVFIPLLIRWLIISHPLDSFSQPTRVIYYYLTSTQVILTTSVFVLLTVTIADVLTLPGKFNIAMLAIFLYSFLFLRLYKRIFSFPNDWLIAPIAHADYRTAFERLDILERKLGRDVTFVQVRGGFFVLTGRFAEAEQLLRLGLQDATGGHQRISLLLSDLGCVIMWQERYDEAARVLEAAIQISPKEGYAYCNLAALYLYEGKAPERALSILDEYLRIVPIQRIKNKLLAGAILADRAWALALMGQLSEAEAVFRQALDTTDKTSKPSLAALHYTAGKMYMPADQKRAEQSFQRAIQIDPNGASAVLSTQALEKMKAVTAI